MNHRERVFEILNGNIPDIIPSLGECPMDVTCLKDVLPEKTGNNVIDRINEAVFYDNSGLGVGIGFKSDTISKSQAHHTYRYETGAVWHEKYDPVFCREAVEFPINDIDDIEKFIMPDPAANVDLKKLKEDVKAYKDAGYFVQGSAPGAWYGIYYYLTKFENILMWMAIEQEAAKALFDMMSDYCLKASELLLEAGVDSIFTASDLGAGKSLLFSPDMFYQYVFPWLRKLSALCHSKGKILHLHSHGHIQDIMDGIVESGVDLLNPVGPSDYNDLKYFKEKWGQKICFMGGITTTINKMSKEEIDSHVRSVMETGVEKGRFIPRTESGIPPMSKEMTLYYLDTLKKYRIEFGSNKRR